MTDDEMLARAAAVRPWRERVSALEAELAAERARTDALVASLPKCGHGRPGGAKCGAPATRANSISTDHERCDPHEIWGTQLVYDAIEHTWAEPLRAILDARDVLSKMT